MKKFDAIIGNPPFNKPGTKGGKCFWHFFAEWSFKHAKTGGIVALITPDNWLISNEKHNLNIRYMAGNMKTTFPVKFEDANVSARCWISKKESYTGNTNFDGYSINLKKLPYYPLNGKHVDVFEKLLKNVNLDNEETIFIFKAGVDTRNIKEQDFTISTKKDKDHLYPVYYTNSTIKWWSLRIENLPKQKVMFSKNSKIDNVFYDNGKHGANDGMFYKIVSSKKEGDNLIAYLNSKVIKFLLTETNRKVTMTATILKNLPAVPLDKEWSDQELYEYFDLTKKEIDMIEKVIK